MPGYNHYRDCVCGWCVKLGGGGRRAFNSAVADAYVILKERGYREGSYASCFVNPNARCPVCGAAVFFYSNADGSRVFFDELGQPWPKHECTDNGRTRAVRTPTKDYPVLRRRKLGEIAEIFDAFSALPVDPRTQRQEKYSVGPASVFVVEWAVRQGFANYLKSVELVGGQGEVSYFKFDSQKFEAKAGDIFSADGVTISFPELTTDKGSRPFKVWVIAEREFDLLVPAATPSSLDGGDQNVSPPGTQEIG
jgi:hypothetical protein